MRRRDGDPVVGHRRDKGKRDRATNGASASIADVRPAENDLVADIGLKQAIKEGLSAAADRITNDVDLMRDAAVAGRGVACLPLPHAERQLAEGALVEVLGGWAPVLPSNHLYYPSRRQPSAAFRVFVYAMRV